MALELQPGCFCTSSSSPTHSAYCRPDLEETFENLILDQLDVGVYGPALLDTEVELDHVFD